MCLRTLGGAGIAPTGRVRGADGDPAGPTQVTALFPQLGCAVRLFDEP
ncbi:hypothetical protein AB0I51_38300 [Streptomyces sp. NPDC050549]